MKRTIYMLVTVAIVIALFLFFTGAVGDRDKSSENDEETNIITIGVYEPLTGVEAEGGLKELLGIRYAHSVTPTVEVAGVSYTIKLLELDNESDAETAILDAKYLIKEGVIAALGSYGAELSAAGVPVLAESGIPCIVPSSALPDLSEAGSSIFSASYDYSFQASVMANYSSSKGYKTVVVLSQKDDVYSKTMAKCFTDEFIRLEGNVFAYTYEQGQNNFQSIAAMIQSVKADAVFLPATIGTTANVIKQLRRNDINCPILGGDSYDSTLLFESCSNYGRDVYFCSSFSDTDRSNLIAAEFVPKFASWIKADGDRYQMNGQTEAVSHISALAYDSYMALVDALSRSESLNPDDISLALAACDYSGTTGKVSFDQSGALIEKHCFVKTFDVEEKKFEIMQTSSVGK